LRRATAQDAPRLPRRALSNSQSEKATESSRPRGYEAGEKIPKHKRDMATDLQGNPVGLLAHVADAQDRDGTPRVLASVRAHRPWLRHIFADGVMPAKAARPFERKK
jgi:hypothetical protein